MTNLVEILKNAPKGLELYSPAYGRVKFETVNEKIDKIYKIAVTVIDDKMGWGALWFDECGRVDPDGECLLFPSKECKNWSGWQYTLFKPGHFITAMGLTFYIKSKLNCDFNVICKNGDTGKINPITAFNFAPTGKIEQFYAELERYGYTLVNGKLEKRKDNKADVLLEEFLRKFKTTLIDSKPFTIDDFKPFDKVLVRTANGTVWWPRFYDSYTKMPNGQVLYTIIGTGAYPQCIPYNDETKHLVNTSEPYNGKYKTW